MTEPLKPTRPIHRPSRLGAVWLSYRTRWFLWLMLLGAAAIFVPAAVRMWPATYYDMGSNHAPVLATRTVIPQPSQPGPRASLSFREDGGSNDKEPDWTKLRSLTLHAGAEHCRPLWTPGAIPHLESLTVFGWIVDHQVVKLCELYDLKSLTLVSSGDLTDIAMESLAAEPQLEFLNLGGLLPFPTMVVPGETPEAVQERKARKDRLIHNAVSLKWPSSLRTLIFDDVTGTPQSRLVEWQQLPRLQTLATRFQPIEGTRLADETIETLRQLPHLRQLYLRENGAAESELAVEQQRLLPHIRVRPFSHDPTRGRRAALVLAVGMFVVTLLAMQISTQFITPVSLLTPRFAKPHLGFAGGIASLSVLGSFVALLAADCSIAVALGLCGASVFMLAIGAKLMRRLCDFPMPGLTNFGFVMPSVVFPLIGLQLMVMAFGAEFDWFLRGQHPWISWGLLAGTIWGAFDLVKWQIELPRLLEEAGCATSPLGMFNTAGWAEWGRSIAAIREAKGKKPPFALRGRDTELDRLVESLHERRGMTGLTLWRLGNVQSTMKFTLFFAALFIPMAFGAAIVSIATGSDDFSWPENGLNFLWPMVGQVLFMLLIFPFAFAWQRRSMLATELLRPMSRRDWIGIWFQGIAGEMAPLLIMATAFAGIAWSTGQFVKWAPLQLFITAMLFVGIVLVVLATMLSLITVESIWWCLVPILLLGVISFVILLANPPFKWTTSTQALTVSLIYATAIVGMSIARWRWRNWEVGLIK